MKTGTQEKINHCIDVIEMTYLALCVVGVVAYLIHSFCF